MAALENRSIVVTGANSGIGRAVVARFLSEGASVVGVARKPGSLGEFESHKNFKALIGDVCDYQTSKAAVDLACTQFGKLDTFIANAGVWDFYKRISKLTPTELGRGYEAIFDVNVKGVLYGAHAAYPGLKQSGGSVIATGSNACFRAGGGGSLYTASKFALRGLVLQLSREFAPEVRVNAVAPGATDTPLGGSAQLGQEGKTLNASADRIRAMGEHIPLGVVSQPEDHLGAFLLLASKHDAKYMTGTVLLSDGGLVA